MTTNAATGQTQIDTATGATDLSAFERNRGQMNINLPVWLCTAPDSSGIGGVYTLSHHGLGSKLLCTAVAAIAA